jgi:DHA1 family bicyclomycin/chloramphenicol resistance-like MFS transporter
MHGPEEWRSRPAFARGPGAQNPAYRPTSFFQATPPLNTSPNLALWRGPSWALALLLASLSMLGPFAIDAYLPAFDGMAHTLQATPVQMQQTLSVFLVAFAVMNLFHGALSDSLGRRPVVLWCLAGFALGSLGCAWAHQMETLLFWRMVQGLSCGGGMVVARAVVRDLYPPVDAQRVMSHITLWFGVSPALAPLLGGLVYVQWGWRAVFFMLVGLACVLWLNAWRFLPETLPHAQRHPLHPGHLMRGYGQLLRKPRLVALCLATGLPFNCMFLYVVSAPAFLGGSLGLRPDQYYWLFCLTIMGIMGGAALSGLAAGRWPARVQLRWGKALILFGTALNVAQSLFLPASVWWCLPPVAVFTLGWALVAPVLTIMVLDLAPERRGMASSLHAALGSGVNAAVAGLLSPWVMHSVVALAMASLALAVLGLLAWWWGQAPSGNFAQQP